MGINGIAPLFLQFFFMNFLAYIHEKHNQVRIYHVIFCILDLVIMFFAQSKTSMGALIISFLAALIVKKPKYIVAIIISVTCIASLFFSNADTLAEILPRRYDPNIVALSIQHGATGRTPIWHEYLSNATSVKTLLFGNGYGAGNSVLYQKPFSHITHFTDRITQPKIGLRYYNYFPSFHSFYVQLFVENGGLALLFYLIIMSKVLIRLVIGVIRGKIHWIYLSIYITLILECTFQTSLFNDIFLLFYAVVLPEVCNNVDKNHSMITLQNFCRIFLNRKMIIAGVTLAVMTISLVHCVFSPTIYRSRCVISPTEYTKSLGRFPGAVIARILYGNTLAAKTAEKFDLVNVYGKNNITETVNFIKQNIIHANDTLLGRMITFEILDTSPDRAAKISDFMIDCLNEHIHQIYSAANSELSALYTHAADTARTELLEAEDSLVQFQKDNRIILAQPQVRDLVRRITSMRNEISAKEREIYTLKSYASSENVRLKLAQSQLQALQSELADLEVINETQNVPAAMIGYTDRLRRVERLRSRMFEAMDQLYLLRNDPREFLPVVHIIDKAHELVEEFKPYKAAVMIIGLFTGLSLGILLSILDYKFRRA